MPINIDKLAKDMKKIIGEEHVFADKNTRMVYAQDPMAHDIEEHNIPYVVVRPSGAEEVSQILKYANEQLIPVHTHGSGTSFAGLARPKVNCILLDMSRMYKIEVFPERGYFEVGVGAHLAEVENVLLKYDALLPACLGSQLVATIGGVISVNTSAHIVDAALGKPGDFVLGLELVLPTGEILHTGTESLRRPAGTELTRLFVGSEGLLDVKTMVRMRLIPLPKFRHIVAYYKSMDDILETVMEMYKQLVPAPLFFEFLDEKAAKLGYKAVGLPEPTGPVAMIQVHCLSEAGSEEMGKNFLEFMKVGNPIETKLVRDMEEWKKIWSARSEFANYLFRGGITWGSEISPRMDKLKDAYHEAESVICNLESCKNAEFYSYGHIGGPTIHARAFVPTKEVSNEVKRAVGLEIREKTEGINVKYGGCGGEWGLTAGRIPFIKEKYGEVYYELLVKLKRVMDPNNILDRGNLEGWT